MMEFLAIASTFNALAAIWIALISANRQDKIDNQKQTIDSYRWYTLAMKEKFPRQVEEFENSIAFDDLPNVTNILNDRIEQKKEV